MEEGTSSSGPRSGIVASEGKRGTQLATGLPPLFEQVAQSHHLADKDDVGPSDHTLPDILQQFDNLDKSSARFPNQLVDLLSEKEYTTCITRLRDEDVTWFIDYLDNVCVIFRFTNFLLSFCRPSTPSTLLPLRIRNVWVNSEGYVAPGKCYRARTSLEFAWTALLAMTAVVLVKSFGGRSLVYLLNPGEYFLSARFSLPKARRWGYFASITIFPYSHI